MNTPQTIKELTSFITSPDVVQTRAALILNATIEHASAWFKVVKVARLANPTDPTAPLVVWIGTPSALRGARVDEIDNFSPHIQVRGMSFDRTSGRSILGRSTLRHGRMDVAKSMEALSSWIAACKDVQNAHAKTVRAAWDIHDALVLDLLRPSAQEIAVNRALWGISETATVVTVPTGAFNRLTRKWEPGAALYVDGRFCGVQTLSGLA